MSRDFICKHHFEIKDYNDVYCAVGKIIEAAQEWEAHYKSYVRVIGFNMDKLGIATLNRINKRLFDNKIISEKEYKDLDMVISERNYINHEFFLDKSYCHNYALINERLDNIINYIYEATDVVNNLIAKHKNDPIRCPTIFDDEE